jgi:hypothetical protein
MAVVVVKLDSAVLVVVVSMPVAVVVVEVGPAVRLNLTFLEILLQEKVGLCLLLIH